MSSNEGSNQEIGAKRVTRSLLKRIGSAEPEEKTKKTPAIPKLSSIQDIEVKKTARVMLTPIKTRRNSTMADTPQGEENTVKTPSKRITRRNSFSETPTAQSPLRRTRQTSALVDNSTLIAESPMRRTRKNSVLVDNSTPIKAFTGRQLTAIVDDRDSSEEENDDDTHSKMGTPEPNPSADRRVTRSQSKSPNATALPKTTNKKITATLPIIASNSPANNAEKTDNNNTDEKSETSSKKLLAEIDEKTIDNQTAVSDDVTKEILNVNELKTRIETEKANDIGINKCPESSNTEELLTETSKEMDLDKNEEVQNQSSRSMLKEAATVTEKTATNNKDSIAQEALIEVFIEAKQTENIEKEVELSLNNPRELNGSSKSFSHETSHNKEGNNKLQNDLEKQVDKDSSITKEHTVNKIVDFNESVIVVDDEEKKTPKMFRKTPFPSKTKSYTENEISLNSTKEINQSLEITNVTEESAKTEKTDEEENSRSISIKSAQKSINFDESKSIICIEDDEESDTNELPTDSNKTPYRSKAVKNIEFSSSTPIPNDVGVTDQMSKKETANLDIPCLKNSSKIDQDNISKSKPNDATVDDDCNSSNVLSMNNTGKLETSLITKDTANTTTGFGRKEIEKEKKEIAEFANNENKTSLRKSSTNEINQSLEITNVTQESTKTEKNDENENSGNISIKSAQKSINFDENKSGVFVEDDNETDTNELPTDSNKTPNRNNANIEISSNTPIPNDAGVTDQVSKKETGNLDITCLKNSSRIDLGNNSESEQNGTTVDDDCKSSNTISMNNTGKMENSSITKTTANTTTGNAEFAKSWSQSIKGKLSNNFIDGFGRKEIDKEKKEIAALANNEIKTSLTNTSDDEDDEEEEETEETNIFIDIEALECDEDSMNSSERRYMEENEIPERGESIGSQDTEDINGSEVEEESLDSFIVSENSAESDDLDSDISLLCSDDEKFSSAEDDDERNENGSLKIDKNVSKDSKIRSLPRAIQKKKFSEHNGIDSDDDDNNEADNNISLNKSINSTKKDRPKRMRLLSEDLDDSNENAIQEIGIENKSLVKEDRNTENIDELISDHDSIREIEMKSQSEKYKLNKRKSEANKNVSLNKSKDSKNKSSAKKNQSARLSLENLDQPNENDHDKIEKTESDAKNDSGHGSKFRNVSALSVSKNKSLRKEDNEHIMDDDSNDSTLHMNKLYKNSSGTDEEVINTTKNKSFMKLTEKRLTSTEIDSNCKSDKNLKSGKKSTDRSTKISSHDTNEDFAEEIEIKFKSKKDKYKKHHKNTLNESRRNNDANITIKSDCGIESVFREVSENTEELSTENDNSDNEHKDINNDSTVLLTKLYQSSGTEEEVMNATKNKSCLELTQKRLSSTEIESNYKSGKKSEKKEKRQSLNKNNEIPYEEQSNIPNHNKSINKTQFNENSSTPKIHSNKTDKTKTPPKLNISSPSLLKYSEKLFDKQSTVNTKTTNSEDVQDLNLKEKKIKTSPSNKLKDESIVNNKEPKSTDHIFARCTALIEAANEAKRLAKLQNQNKKLRNKKKLKVIKKTFLENGEKKCVQKINKHVLKAVKHSVKLLSEGLIPKKLDETNTSTSSVENHVPGSDKKLSKRLPTNILQALSDRPTENASTTSKKQKQKYLTEELNSSSSSYPSTHTASDHDNYNDEPVSQPDRILKSKSDNNKGKKRKYEEAHHEQDVYTKSSSAVAHKSKRKTKSKKQNDLHNIHLSHPPDYLNHDNNSNEYYVEPESTTGNKKKKLGILVNTTVGAFVEEPLTPKKIVSGFIETPVTPRPHGWKIKNLDSATSTSSEKSKKRKRKWQIVAEPKSQSAAYTSIGAFTVTSIKEKTVDHYKPKNAGLATDFRVKVLDRELNTKPSSSDNSHMDYKMHTILNKKIQRERRFR